MATLVASKTTTEDPVAKSDDHHDALAADPTVSQFPQGSTFGSTSNASPATGFATGGSAFSTPSTGGFGTAGGFGSSTSGFSGGSGFGTSSFGSGSSNNMGMPGTSNMNMSMSNAPVLTGAGSNAAQDADVLVKNNNEDWINKKWRPVMGWMYMAVCTFDFMVAPILWSVLQAMTHGNVTSQWQPVTLQGAGLFHVAMGAVLGIAAYGRTKEKLESKQ